MKDEKDFFNIAELTRRQEGSKWLRNPPELFLLAIAQQLAVISATLKRLAKHIETEVEKS